MQREARNALLAAALLALMTWQVTVRGPFIAWDWPVHEYVDPRVPEGSALTAIDWVSNVGGQRHYTVPILVGVGAWIAYRQRRYRPLIAIVAGLATIFFVGYGIKFGLARTPPAAGPSAPSRHRSPSRSCTPPRQAHPGLLRSVVVVSCTTSPAKRTL